MFVHYDKNLPFLTRHRANIEMEENTFHCLAGAGPYIPAFQHPRWHTASCLIQCYAAEQWQCWPPAAPLRSSGAAGSKAEELSPKDVSISTDWY